MSKKITDAKIIFNFKDGTQEVLQKEFGRVRYIYDKDIESNVDKIEFSISTIDEEIEDKAIYFSLGDILKNKEIDNISYNYLLVNENTNEIEEKVLFNTLILNKNISLWEFTNGFNGSRNNDTENNLFSASLLTMKFKVEEK